MFRLILLLFFIAVITSQYVISKSDGFLNKKQFIYLAKAKSKSKKSDDKDDDEDEVSSSGTGGGDSSFFKDMKKHSITGKSSKGKDPERDFKRGKGSRSAAKMLSKSSNAGDSSMMGGLFKEVIGLAKDKINKKKDDKKDDDDDDDDDDDEDDDEDDEDDDDDF